MTARASLETPRLLLRWMTEADAGLMLAVWNDPDFIRHVTDRGVRTEAEARQAMRDSLLKLYDDCGYGPYLIEPLEGGSPMGICGFFQRENFEYPDIGYAQLPAYRGQGYAFEAAEAVVAHARDHMALPKLVAIVSPANKRSTRLLEKLGMSFERSLRMPGDEQDVSLYGMSLAVTERC